MEISEIHDLFSDHFSYLDRVVEDNLPNHDWKHRGPVVMAFSEPDRDLYFVHDVISITCNAGMGAWIHYNLDDYGWIDDSVRAFGVIGRGEVGDNLKECRERYIAAGGSFDSWNDEDLSMIIWESEDQIVKDLYEHLIRRRFSLQRPSPK